MHIPANYIWGITRCRAGFRLEPQHLHTSTPNGKLKISLGGNNPCCTQRNNMGFKSALQREVFCKGCIPSASSDHDFTKPLQKILFLTGLFLIGLCHSNLHRLKAIHADFGNWEDPPNVCFCDIVV